MFRSVYTFWAATGECLYVGCTTDFPRRMAAHRRERPWWGDVARIEVDVLPEFEAGVAEIARIQELNPRHNRAYTDHDTPRRSNQPTMRENARKRAADLLRRSAVQ